MEWSPPASTDICHRNSVGWSVRHCWFALCAAKENQTEASTIGIDRAKRVFQIHIVNPGTGAIHSKGRLASSSWKLAAALIIGPERWHDSATMFGLSRPSSLRL
jgi:hypothetical protein